MNYCKDHDPHFGDHIESDPIGLAGDGYSTYAYVNGNPASNDDPDGLQVAAGAEVGALVEPGLDTVKGTAIGVVIETAVVQEVCNMLGDRVRLGASARGT